MFISKQKFPFTCWQTTKESDVCLSSLVKLQQQFRKMHAWVLLGHELIVQVVLVMQSSEVGQDEQAPGHRHARVFRIPSASRQQVFQSLHHELLLLLTGNSTFLRHTVICGQKQTIDQRSWSARQFAVCMKVPPHADRRMSTDRRPHNSTCSYCTKRAARFVGPSGLKQTAAWRKLRQLSRKDTSTKGINNTTPTLKSKTQKKILRETPT